MKTAPSHPDQPTSVMITDTELNQGRAVLTKADGTRWSYLLEGSEGIVLADACNELIEYLIPGYLAHPDTAAGRRDASIARYQFAVDAAQHIQLMINVDATNLNGFNPEDETEDTLTAIFAEKKHPFRGQRWDHPVVPLVLVATDYAPFVPAHVRPSGNVLWIDPSDELAFLTTLSVIGYISFMTQERRQG